MTARTVRELLAECATLINAHGVDSPQVTEFIAANRSNAEFVELAELSRKLKRALVTATPPVPIGNSSGAGPGQH